MQKGVLKLLTWDPHTFAFAPLGNSNSAISTEPRDATAIKAGTRMDASCRSQYTAAVMHMSRSINYIRQYAAVQ